MRLDDPAIKDRIIPALRRVGTALLRCVVPIFSLENGDVEQVGCGFFVAHGPHHFIITAAHVVRDKIRSNVLFIWFDGDNCGCFSLTHRFFQLSLGTCRTYGTWRRMILAQLR